MPFGEAVKRRIVPNSGGIPYGTIRFDGSIVPRPADKRILGNTFIANPGDVVFSRIDVRNGAIGVIPLSGQPMAFTNEFPIYDVRGAGVLIPEFVQILCRTEVFRSQIEALVAGHSGRKRVSAAQFESVSIPALDLEYQARIVRLYQTKMNEARRLSKESTPLFESSLLSFLAALGIEFKDAVTAPRTFSVSSARILRWGYRPAAEIYRGLDPDPTSPYPVLTLGEGELCSIGRGVSKTPRNRSGPHMKPYLRVANLQPWGIDLADVKQLNIPPDQMQIVRLEVDDVLVCRNNSLELIGKAALWEGEIEECAHDDHVFRVRVNRDLLNPRYLFYYLSSSFARSWFKSRAQITTNLAGISGSALTELPIPLPPLHVQEKLASEVDEARLEAIEMRETARRLRSEAALDAEWAILGQPADIDPLTG